jgi:hypothetical protein
VGNRTVNWLPCPQPALAADTPTIPEHTISVTGTGRVTLVPDIADLRLGVSITKPTVAEARDAAASAMTSVVAALKAAGIAAKDIQTATLSLQAVYDYNSKNESQYDPEGFCLPPGGPRMFATPYPGEILQLPDQKRVVMIFEGGTHIWREIYMDGREHPKGDELNPTYLGHSVGHYEDNNQTLVVDVVGFNENSWLDYFGHPHTEKMHVVERFTRPNKNTLHYQATVDDPGAYTKPFTLAWDIPWNGTSELSEYICQENNRYLNRLQDDFGQPVFGPKTPGVKPVRPAGGTK